MLCEICGDNEAEFIVLVEGAKLPVCHGCSKFGKVLVSLASQRRAEEAAAGEKKYARTQPEFDLVEDYAEKIKNARMKTGFSVEDFAKKIAEKKAFLEKIESGHAKPPEGLALKLQKELGIKLLEEVSDSISPAGSSSSKGVTLGDIVFLKKKKKGDE
ncbi:Uncharacterised protein [Candidatus Gugararchaeum adminiculabundum]|nr:Uncharacterised protein [Candidatus Gugararchaeum adminiculabundum]